MTEPERTNGWVELVNWVRWLHDVYELSVEERLPQCWPHHPGLVEELRALKTWREEIYRTHPSPSPEASPSSAGQKASAQPGPGQSGAAGAGQAARYWHAELRQVLHAAATQYAAGCPAGHRGATILADVNAGLHERWLDGDGETRLPAPLLSPPTPHTSTKELPSMTTIEARVLLAAIEQGQAHPIGELVQDYIHYDGSWWTPLAPAVPETGTAPSEDRLAQPTGRERAGQEGAAVLWQRIPEGDFSERLDASAQRIRAGDQAVQAQRPRTSRRPSAQQE
ncbi:hypothetical protein [Kineosporia sp. NBRC 101731]|uniref:hypothetical protein n=1 Tax=Kineosporia sp. NBRC 101731 TaxID=3032199 RepID=UPI002554A08B|nr:hypothetical protein [Kineosporia sp. NBRC 101731]